MTAETAKALAELAEATGRTEDEILEGAVALYAVHRLLVWTPSPVAPAQVEEA